MVQFDPKAFVPGPNEDLLNMLRRNMSSDYRARIPEATQANMRDQLRGIMDYDANRNEFINALVNRIGLVIATGKNWTNPLAKFKRGVLEDGDTIEEVYTGLIKAKEYDPQREHMEREIFGTHKPDVATSFHELNRQNYYPITINETVLRRAFLSSQMGLSTFITQVMQAPTNSDQWDEFTLTARLFREFYDNDGFFKVRVPDINAVTSGEADAKAVLRTIRAYSEKIKFPSTQYNPARMPSWADPDELEVFVTPEGLAALDVEALAVVFNIDRARIQQRITVIPEEALGIPGAQAIITTRDFFVIADTFYDTRAQPNPVGLTTNHFLHHHQIISASRFVPAILLTATDEPSVIKISDGTVTDISEVEVFDRNGTEIAAGSELDRNAFYNVKAKAILTNPENGANDAVSFAVEGKTSDFTMINNNGTLAIGYDERGTNDEDITIRVTSVANPSKSKVVVFGLKGDIAQLWPNPQVVADPGVATA
jgi:hypothetical protein